MTNVAENILEWIEAKWAALKSSTVLSAAETDVKAIGGGAWAIITSTGAQDVYEIAVTALQAAVPGASWLGILESVGKEVLAAGKDIEAKVVAFVTAQAQADLIAAGKLAVPVASAPVTATVTGA